MFPNDETIFEEDMMSSFWGARVAAVDRGQRDARRGRRLSDPEAAGGRRTVLVLPPVRNTRQLLLPKEKVICSPSSLTPGRDTPRTPCPSVGGQRFFLCVSHIVLIHRAYPAAFLLEAFCSNWEKDTVCYWWSHFHLFLYILCHAFIHSWTEVMNTEHVALNLPCNCRLLPEKN